MINYNYKILFNNDLTVPFQGAVRLKCTSAETRRVNSVNDTNMAIAQMNNEYNERLLDKQLNYNLEQWNRENEYNSPLAQSDRLKQAGLNPALFMSGSSNTTGVGGSHLGINPIPASEAGRQQVGNPDNGANTIQAFQNLADNLNNFDVNRSSAELQHAQAGKIQVETKYAAANALADISQKLSSVRDNDSKAALNDIQADLKRSTFSDDVEAARLGNEATQSQIGVNNAQATYLGTVAQLNQKELEYFDRNALADLSMKASIIMKNHADASLARQMIKTEVAKAANFDEDTRGKRLNNNIVEKTTDALIRSANAAALDSETNADFNVETYKDRVDHVRNNTGPDVPWHIPGTLERKFKNWFGISNR